MFQQLNREEGITIFLVTHDADVARHAERVIHIQDGVIQDGTFEELRLGEEKYRHQLSLPNMAAPLCHGGVS